MLLPASLFVGGVEDVFFMSELDSMLVIKRGGEKVILEMDEEECQRKEEDSEY